MIYLLIILLSIMLIAGILFLVFIDKIILWASYKFGGVERKEKSVALLKSPFGKTFLWRQRVRGIFYIMIVLYVVIGFAAPKIINYVPWYILFIPLILGLVLSILMFILSRRLSKQDDESVRMIAQEGNNKYLRTAKIIQVLLFMAILIYAGIVYGWSVIPLISQDIGFDISTLHQITIVVAFLGIICLVYGYFLPKLMTKTYKQKSQTNLRKWLPFHPNLPRAEGGSLAVHITRAAIFVAVAVYGLVLGILGVGWQITLPFFVTSAIALALTFPTQKRWKRLLDEFGNYNTPNVLE